jgi:hypothetical protein
MLHCESTPVMIESLDDVEWWEGPAQDRDLGFREVRGLPGPVNTVAHQGAGVNWSGHI